MNYLEWNDVLAQHFFNESRAGKEVLLYVNDDLINELGKPFGADVTDFIEAVKQGPNWASRSGFCQKAYQAFDGWRGWKYEYPPYIAYLSFFVLAGVTETGYAPHAYYPGFWQRLGEPANNGMPPSFGKMIDLWGDLEKWSQEERHEELGRFVARWRVEWVNVGLPLAQTVLSDHERKLLPNLFDRAGLDPTDPPSPEIIPKILSRYGNEILEVRTRSLLGGGDSESHAALKDALTGLVLDELESWDGELHEQIVQEGAQPSNVRAGLRLCLNYDKFSQSVRVYARFKTNKTFPDEGLQLLRKHDGSVWHCNEIQQGWSSALKDISHSPPLRLDGVVLNWEDGDQLIDGEYGWHARLRGADVRIFRKHVDNLPDWVETQRLERNAEFFIACTGHHQDKILSWRTGGCEQIEKCDVLGLPPGWILIYGRNATVSCPGIDILSVSTTVRLRLIDGIRTGRGNAYFMFAPPKVILENGSGSEKVTLNGITLKQSDRSDSVFILPKDVPLNVPLRIEVDLGEQKINKTIRLEDFTLQHSFDETPCRNKYGEYGASADETNTCGALVTNSTNDVPVPEFLPTHLAGRIIFIGHRPGEIIDWPQEHVPDSWHPVWAIVRKSKKDWAVYFCGNPEGLITDEGSFIPVENKARVKQWKEAVWYNRKVTDPPKIKAIRRIWELYQRAANNA